LPGQSHFGRVGAVTEDVPVVGPLQVGAVHLTAAREALSDQNQRQPNMLVARDRQPAGGGALAARGDGGGEAGVLAPGGLVEPSMASRRSANRLRGCARQRL
jgi:hypothetical protein